MSAWANGISAITLFVPDLAAAKAFYERVFGAQLIFEDPSSAAFEFGATIVNLLVETEAPELIEPARVAPAGVGSRMQLTITVDDVDAVCDELRARGVEFLNGPIDRPWGIRTAAFADPAGHVWEIAK
ncbi:MAG TPA: VOC family protein [Candidatus Limnocylindrales bacterium]|nr:VOC family protein [Candidatus Limnocylindrales bacterium]